MEKAKKLGIPELHLTAALLLVRNLRVNAIKEGLDPRATRIAIIYADMVDAYFANQKLNMPDMARLSEIAKDFFDETKKGRWP